MSSAKQWRISISISMMNLDGLTQRVWLCWLIVGPAFQFYWILQGSPVAILSTKGQLKLNRPVYAEQAMLDISKVCRNYFWYNQNKNIYREKA